MRALGGYGIWFEQGAFDGEVVGCALRDLGAGGIRIGRGHGFSGGEGECERHNVTDNVITDGGHIWQEGCGVLSQHAASIDILHNEISYMRYTGVLRAGHGDMAAQLSTMSAPCSITSTTSASVT